MMKRIRFPKINLARWQAWLHGLSRSTKRGLILAFGAFLCALMGHLLIFHEPAAAAPNPDLALLNAFVPTESPPGDPVTYRLTFNNNTAAPVNITSLNHTLPSSPGNLVFDAAATTNTCGSTVNITTGSAVGSTGSFAITGGTIPVGAPGCIIEIPVRGFSAGNHNDTIPALALSTDAGENPDPTAATLQVDGSSPATLNKSFAPNTIPGDGRSIVTIRINNPNEYDLTGTTATPTLTDDLPSSPFQLIVDERAGAPTPTTDCTGGTVNIKPGGTGIELIGGTLPNESFCSVTFPVTQPNGGAYSNNIPSGSLSTENLISNSNSPSANLNVQTEISITKVFGANSRDEGETTSLAITITNGGGPLTNATLTDALPAPIVVADVPNATTTCTPNGSEALTVTPGASSITLNSANVPSSAQVPGSDATTNSLGSCTINLTVKVDPDVIGNIANSNGSSVTNTIAAGDLGNDEGRTNADPVSDSINVRPAIVVNKGYSNNDAISPGNTSRMTITVRNNSFAVGATGVGFTDTLPGALEIADPPNITNSNCGSPTITGAATTNVLTFSGGTIGTNSTCTVQVDVFLPLGTSVGTNLDNVIPDDSILNDQGLDSNAVTGTQGRLNVVGRVEIVKSFNSSSVRRGVPSTLSISIRNNRRTDTGTTQPLTGVTISDDLMTNTPVANLQIATPANFSQSGCDFSSTPIFTGNTSGSTSFGMTNASIAPVDDSDPNADTCTIQFDVIEIVTTNGPPFTPPVTYTNTTSGFSNIENEPATEDDAVLTVTSPLEGTKTFQSPEVVAGGKSTAVITLTNTWDQPLTVTTFTDSWTQANVTVASPLVASTTCGGTITTTPGTQTVDFVGGVVPAQVGGVQGICTISFEVIMDETGSSSFLNSLPAGSITTAEGFVNPIAVNGTLTRTTANINLNKSFSPTSLRVGDPTTLTVTVTNPSNGIPVTQLGLTDTMPSDMVVFSVPSASTTCSGGTVTAVPGQNTFTLTGASLSDNDSCTVSVRVTLLDTGNKINQLQPGDVFSQENVTNSQLAQATVTGQAAITPGKSFNPTSVEGGEISQLTLTITNNQTNNESGESLSNVSINDTLPADLFVANTPNASTTCPSGTVTVTPGGSVVQMTGATLAPGANCQVQVDVVSSLMGSYQNRIERGDLTAEIQPSIDPMTGGNPTVIENTSRPTATLTVNSDRLPPEILLVKRISAVNGVNVTGFDDGPGGDDNDPHWPSPVSDSLRGALNLSTPVKPGDDLEYSIYFLNTGLSEAFGLTLCDRVPDFTTYQRNTYNNQPNQDPGGIAGSGRGMMLGLGTNEVSLTNGPDGDQGYYFEPNVDPTLTLPNINCDGANTNGAVAVQLSSNVPNATAAGVPVNSYGYIRFTAKVD
ncbi:beta strand repeat-containing protein [Acaryochloris marina NIES-2412]|uniref:beta strand repeat-containing protein n=1 Tax=Acaryochloris marina TaxID=155978 RepID=UPI0040585BF6